VKSFSHLQAFGKNASFFVVHRWTPTKDKALWRGLNDESLGFIS
jgi:hypothetical protein